MSELRDYREWHRAYDDPNSTLSWRLRAVRNLIEQALDRHQGQIRILSACAGDGRDVLGVLRTRSDARRVTATLIEIDAQIAATAVRTGADTQAHVEIRTADAGYTDAYVGAVPAELVVMVGIFGNISDADLRRTIATAPRFCRPGATLLWSRGRDREDLGGPIRAWFAAAGFRELEYATLEQGSLPAVGAVSYEGAAQPLTPGHHLFTFRR